MDAASPGPTPQTSPALAAGRWLRLVQSAWIGGIFCAVFCASMVLLHWRAKSQDPLKAPQVLVLKERLLANPKDEPVKEQIRALDLAVRHRYFDQVHRNRVGAWLALGALGLFVVASKRARHLRQPLPMPQPKLPAAHDIARAATWARCSVSTLALVSGAAALSAAFSSRSLLPANVSQIEKLLAPVHVAALNTFPITDESARNWPQFRGPAGTGFCSDTNTPLAWDVKTGAGVGWKSAISAPGFNSPIVWGDRVFISGGDSSKRVVLCYSLGRGELLWERPVPGPAGAPKQELEIPEQTGYAASTMATDGRRVYAIFATGDLAAFTVDGTQVWSKTLDISKNPHGHASSLVLWQGQLIVQMDQGEAEQKLSRLYAFEGTSGRVLWQRNRPVPSSWATPLVISTAGQAQIITLAVPWIIAYAAKDGTELWRVEGLSNEVTPSPLYAAGLVFAVSPSDKLLALRPDGEGDVTKTHLAWSAEDNIPDISSPVGNDELVFTLSTPGVLTCYDAKNGKKQWDQDFAMTCQASPAIAGERLYLATEKGTVLVIQVARAFKELARNNLDETLFASPAFAQGSLLFRGEKHLFCLRHESRLAANTHAEH